MRRCALLTVLAMTLVASGCDLSRFLGGDGRTRALPFERITLAGVDRLSIGGTFEVVVRTEEEYEQLIYDRYQRPLNEYCNEHFSDEREQLEQQNPNLSEEEIQERLNEICIDRTPVFDGLQNVRHPEIDFSEHSLLGQDAHASGCSTPDYDIELTRSGDTYTYSVKVTQYGLCEMFIAKNLWILTPKIPEGSDVAFEKEYQLAARR